MSTWVPLILNIVLFDALWTTAILGAGRTWWWVAPVLILASAAVQLRRSPAPRAEAALVLTGAAAGVTLDAASHFLGLFRYASASRAEFLVVFLSLWINFGTTLRPALRWTWQRPLVGAALGAAGGPLAYWMAARLGAISAVEPAWRGFAWCALQYAAMLPLWGIAASLAFSDVPGPIRRQSRPASTPPPGTPAS